MILILGIIILSLLAALAGLGLWAYKRDQSKDAEHEAQLLELEKLYNEQKTKFETAIANTLQEIDTYQQYIAKISDVIKYTDKKLQEIDAKGSFKSDDEIGFFFKNVQLIQDILNTFNVSLTPPEEKK